MPDDWYTEVYSHIDMDSREYLMLPDFAATLAYLKEFNKLKAQGSTDVLRILPPTSATDHEHRELMESGTKLG